jgi:hypothetical protein
MSQFRGDLGSKVMSGEIKFEDLKFNPPNIQKPVQTNFNQQQALLDAQLQLAQQQAQLQLAQQKTIEQLTLEDRFYEKLGIKYHNTHMFGVASRMKGRFLLALVLVGGYFAYKKFKK